MFLKIAQSGRNQFWRYLLTLLLVVTGVILGQLPFYFLAMATGAAMGYSEFEVAAIIDSMDFGSLGISNNLAILLMLLSFVTGLAGLYLGVRYIHQRSFLQVVTSRIRIDWKRVYFSFGYWMLLAIGVEIVFYLMDPGNYSWQFRPSEFFILLLIALFVLPLQTSFEELLFRGYLMQGIGLITPYRWIPLVITSLAFGLMHWMNPEVAAFGTGITMAYYIGVGLFLGILTLLDDGLELALGIHAATNIYGALFVTFDESAIQTAALFHMQDVDMKFMLLGFVLSIFVFFYLAKRKYGWHDWSKVYGKVSLDHDDHANEIEGSDEVTANN